MVLRDAERSGFEPLIKRRAVERRAKVPPAFAGCILAAKAVIEKRRGRLVGGEDPRSLFRPLPEDMAFATRATSRIT